MNRGKSCKALLRVVTPLAHSPYCKIGDPDPENVIPWSHSGTQRSLLIIVIQALRHWTTVLRGNRGGQTGDSVIIRECQCAFQISVVAGSCHNAQVQCRCYRPSQLELRL